MKRIFFARILFLLAFFGIASAQMNVKPFPRAALDAKTIAIVNDTHNPAVTDGAMDALKRWGRFTVVEDSDTADITLVFEKKTEHEGTSTQKTGEDGKPETSYGMSFSSSIKMRAELKGSTNAFYSTTTNESKKKAGQGCVLDFQRAYLSAK